MKNLALSKIRDIQRNVLDWIVRNHPSLDLAGRAEDFVKLFEKHISPKSKVLDIGGGWGFYADPLRKRGHEPVVLDVVKPALQKAPVFLYHNTNRIPFPDSSFDVSMLITVMHHVEDLEALLKEARRVTRDKVIVVEDIYNHSLGRLWTKWRDQLYNIEFFGHPGNFKTKDEWIALFADSGFKLNSYEEVYTWLSGLRILNGIFIFEKV